MENGADGSGDLTYVTLITSDDFLMVAWVEALPFRQSNVTMENPQLQITSSQKFPFNFSEWDVVATANGKSHRNMHIALRPCKRWHRPFGQVERSTCQCWCFICMLYCSCHHVVAAIWQASCCLCFCQFGPARHFKCFGIVLQPARFSFCYQSSA